MSQTDIPLIPDYSAKQIWAIGGGKGGTGKTIVAASISILLAKTGSKVVAIDADLGGANLHTCLGIRYPKTTIADFLLKKITSFDELLIDTPIENLKFISGANDFLTIANIPYAQKQKLIKYIRNIPADYIILDLGAGTSFNVLDLFLISDCSVVVVVPEPTSVENVYRFIKCAILRRLNNSLNTSRFQDIFKLATEARGNESIKTLYDLLERIYRMDSSVAADLEKKIDTFSPKLIVNQVRENDSIMIGSSIRDITKKYLGVGLDYAGYIPYDERVSEAIKKFKPLILEYPNCSASLCMNLTLKKLLSNGQPVAGKEAK
ncbi:MAG: AAA family ATPase [Nitrospinae bacterium]|nr:AAA family ATPase [Nitrospinota bacterium]